MNLKKIITVFLILINSAINSQTVITEGPVGGRWTLSGSPYLVTGEIAVPVDSILIIDPGVKIIFNKYCGLTITGRIFAQGTIDDSITFTASDTAVGWNTVKFNQHGQVYPDTSIFDYCKIEYGRPHYPDQNGGGMNIYQSQYIIIRNAQIRKCYAGGAGGGGVYCEISMAILFDKVIIEDNYSKGRGGGVYCNYNDIDFQNVIFRNNKSDYDGGALYVDGAYYSFENVKILNNAANRGGGIYINHLEDYESTSFINCLIKNNEAYTYGGGMYIDETSVYNSTNLYFEGTSIYMNYSGHSADIHYTRGTVLSIPLDTFTVNNPDKYIWQGQLAITAQTYLLGNHFDYDVYVSLQGSDQNSGDFQNPFLTINTALRKVKANTANPGTIHLAEGAYSPGSNGEHFPLYAKDFVTISGAGTDLTTLDAQNSSKVMMITESTSATVQNMTFTGGKKDDNDCGTLYISNASPIINNCILNYNDTLYTIGDHSVGIYGQSDPYFSNCVFTSQMIWSHSEVSIYAGNPKFEHCQFIAPEYNNEQSPGSRAILIYSIGKVYILNDIFSNYGDAISLQGDNIINSCLFHNNQCGIFIYGWYSQPISNCTFIDNAMALVCRSDLDVQNSIFYNNDSIDAQKIILAQETEHYFPTLTIEYSDVQGGQNSVMILDSLCTLVWGDGNIDLNPLYENSDSNQFMLSSSSPCIDAGNPDTTGLYLPEFDLAGYPRVYGSRIDLGAYEWFPVGVQERTYTENSSMEIYPNPSGSYVCFRIKKGYPTSGNIIKIYNSSGQFIETVSVPNGITTLSHSISNYPCGLYYSVLLDRHEPAFISKFAVVR